MPWALCFWFWDYQQRENCVLTISVRVLSHRNVAWCAPLDCSVNMFKADYNVFCAEHFAPCVTLVSQFIVPSACFENCMRKVSNMMKCNAEDFGCSYCRFYILTFLQEQTAGCQSEIFTGKTVNYRK